MAGLDPAIHAFLDAAVRRGCPGISGAKTRYALLPRARRTLFRASNGCFRVSLIKPKRRKRPTATQKLEQTDTIPVRVHGNP
jgi:hypothetical protein